MGLTERSFLERMELMGFTPSRATTNADRLRSMTDEELAEFIAGGFPKDACRGRCGGDESFPFSECVLDWLKEEVEA